MEAGDEAVRADDEHSADFTRRAAIRWHVAWFWEFFRAHRVVLIALRQAALVDQRFADRLTAMLEPGLHHLATHLTSCDRPETTALALSGLWQQFAHGKFVDQQPVLDGSSDEDAIDLLTDLTDRGVNG